MIKKVLMSAFVVLSSIGMSFAQVAVTGTVTDSYGPLVGASVILQGTTRGVTTGLDGTFSISVPDPEKGVLLFQFVGMDDVVYPLNGQTSGIEVNMVETANALDEVVVIGYGNVRRADMTGAISTVSAKTISQAPVSNAAEAIKGRLPGVQITSQDGSPDATINIRVRGGGSITQSNEPLIIVDGFQVANLNDIPPTDIESISVLKDASATAIYGARGANGVVIVTTKGSSADGTSKVTFNTYFKASTLSKSLSVMDNYEFAMLHYELESLNGSSAQQNFIKNWGHPEDLWIYKGNPGHDWEEEVLGRTVWNKYYSLTVQGGTERTRFNLSASFNDDEGLIPNHGYKRTNVGLKVNHNIFSSLRLDINTRFTNTVKNGRGTGSVNTTSTLLHRPSNGLFDFMTLPIEDLDPDEEERQPLASPIDAAYANYRKQDQYRFVGNVALNWDIWSSLRFRSEFSIETLFNNTDEFWDATTGKAIQDGNSLPMAKVTRARTPKYQWTNTLNYVLPINNEKHNVTVILGQEIVSSRGFEKATDVRYFPEEYTAKEALANLGMGQAFPSYSRQDGYDRTASFFGRVNYNFAGKYLADFTMRADASGRFAPGNQWGYFPAGSVAWRISEEEFMKNSRAISDLKLRASFGIAGNNQIKLDLWQQLYSIQTSKPIGFGEKPTNHYASSSGLVPNPDIKWETTLTRNVGLDFSLFRYRLNGTLDVYWNTVKDLLLESKYPQYWGGGHGKQMQNVGQTSNKGVELALNGTVLETKEWEIFANLNFGYNKNKIDKLSSGNTLWELSSNWASTDLREQTDYRIIVGRQSGLMYGYVTDGFYTVDDFNYIDDKWVLKDGIPNSKDIYGANTLLPGMLKLKKLSGDPGGVVNASEDRKVIGNPNPKFSGGFGFDIVWNKPFGKFDLSAFFNFMYDFDVYNAQKIELTTKWKYTYRNMLSMVDTHHRFRYFDDMGTDLRTDPEALKALNANASIWNPGMGRPVIHSWAIEDGSFLRLQNLTIGYTLPRKLLDRIKFSSLRVYVTGSNLFTLTGYSGYDPEVNVQSGLMPNRDRNYYPRSRNYTFGLQLSF